MHVMWQLQIFMRLKEGIKIYTLIYIQQDAMLHSLFIPGNCSMCFWWFHHPSSGARTISSTAPGTCQTVTATCRYHGGVGTAVPTPPP